MPILNDIMDHKVIGPAIRQGEHKGVLGVVRKMIAERFGKPSTRIEAQLSKMSVAELNKIAIRLMRAESLADLFGE